MVSQTNESLEGNPAEENHNAANLPQEFFAKLLDIPSCKLRSGICNGCGRCEH